MVGLRGRDERRVGRALGLLYEEHGGAVFAFALHLCGSREDAEDVVQTAYLHAFRALSAGEQLVNPRAWLMVVVRRQVYNLWRGRRQTTLAQVPEAIDEDSDSEALAELRRVRLVLFSLPEPQHQAFVLRHWSGLSNREIANVLDTSESAVETLLVRARSAILAAGEGTQDACAGVRDRIALGAPSQLDLAHIGRCKGCGRAQQRLARITAAAAVVALVPRAHVAQALAAAVPGFKTGTGIAASLAAGKASAAKLAVAGLVSAGTIAVTAPAAVHAVHDRLHHPTPVHGQPQASARATWQGIPGDRTPGAKLATDATDHRARQSASQSDHTDSGGRSGERQSSSDSGSGSQGDGGSGTQGASGSGSQGDGGAQGGNTDVSSQDGNSGDGSTTDSQATSSSQDSGGDQASSASQSSTDGTGQ